MSALSDISLGKNSLKLMPTMRKCQLINVIFLKDRRSWLTTLHELLLRWEEATEEGQGHPLTEKPEDAEDCDEDAEDCEDSGGGIPTREPQRVTQRDPSTDSDGGQKVRGVLACSALKRNYRELLSLGGKDRGAKVKCTFVVLNGSEEVIRERMSGREHFMPPGLLRSQFEALELPSGEDEGGNPVIMVSDITQPVQVVVNCITKQLQWIIGST